MTAAASTPSIATPEAAKGRSGRFELLGRIAGALWFFILALIYVRTALAAGSSLTAGEPLASAIPMLLSRACIAAFYAISGWLILARPNPVARHAGWPAVVTAFAGTYGAWFIPLLPAAPASPGLEAASAAVTLIGEALIIITILKLGRSFSIAPHARVLVTTGPYRIVRHPLYLTEEIAVVGILLQHIWWASALFMAAHLALQLRRMAYEETLLRGVFPEYEAYAARTARLIPGFW
jgi:protein-S-isoprenylcysteine O-methyltransferase Ste14